MFQICLRKYLYLTSLMMCLWLATGCVYIPISTEMQPGHLDKPHLDDLIGEAMDVVESHLGDPVVRFRESPNKYVFYRFSGEHEYAMAGLLPFYLPIPFADKVTDPVSSCVLLEFDAENRLVRYEISDWSWNRRCLRRFWDRAGLVDLEASLTRAAVQGDTDAAITLVEEFGVDQHGLVSQRLREAAMEGNVQAAVKLAEVFEDWESLRELAKSDSNAADACTRLLSGKPTFSHQRDNEFEARADHKQAEAELQMYYFNIIEDKHLAHYWLCQAADKSLSEAQYRLGVLHQFGSEGLPKDLAIAYMWFFLSASSYAPSANALAGVMFYMTNEQIRDADQRVAEWRPGQCVIDLKARKPG